MDEETVTCTRAELVQIFQIWNDQAEDGDWEQNPFDAGASADKFIQLARDVA